MKQIVIDNMCTSYFITEKGECYNSNTNKFLKGQVGINNGYLSYNLTLPNGNKKRCYAHRLVADNYLAEPQDRNKNQINHIDGNKLNNCSDNLEWVTQVENQQHALSLELRQFDHIFCFNKNKELVAEYKSISEASRAVNLSNSIISQEVNKTIKTLSGGFYWSKTKELGETKDYVNTGKAKKVNQYDLDGKYIMTYESTGIAAKAIGGHHSHIGECCRGKIKTYKKFIWRYVEDIVSPSSESQRS